MATCCGWNAPQLYAQQASVKGEITLQNDQQQRTKTVSVLWATMM